VLLGATCPGPGAFCANEVDGSEFGFNLTIPSGFECTAVFASDTVTAQGRWAQTSTGHAASVQIRQTTTEEPEDAEGVTIEDLADLTTAQGITFQRKKVTVSALSAVSYVGATNLAGGHTLWVTVGGTSDDQALLDNLNTILESAETTS
jgi:hypothetical protein